MQNPRTCDCELNKICKVDEYLDIKNCSCENRLFSKLTLECEDEILNAMETIIEDKNVSCEKNQLPYSYCFIGIYMLAITGFCFYQLLFSSCSRFDKKKTHCRINVK